MVEALTGAVGMVAIVASALVLGMGIGQLVIRHLRKKNQALPVCKVGSEQIEKTAIAALKAARHTRIESERLEKDLRGAAHVL